MKIVARTKNLIHSCLMLACTNTLAQSTDQDVEEIIVVAHRLPVPSSKVASSVSVLTQEDIAEYGNLSIKDILRQTPGVASTSNGGMGATSSLRIRGEEGFRTLILFDGIRLSDPSATQVATPIEHILSDGIGRVEIIRGPQGLNFGADAGGIIALSSQTNEEGLNTSLEAQSGKFGTSQGNLNISGSNGSSDFSIFASQINTDGFNARSDDNILLDDDGYENSTIHLRARTKLTDQIRIQAVHRNVEGDSEYDGCFLQTTIHDCESDYELEASRLSIDYNSETLTHSLGFSKTETDRKFFSADELGFSSAGELNRIEYIGSLNQFDSFLLIYGFDLEEEINGKMERDNEGYYLEFLSNFSTRLTISGGVRSDENDD
ncbi:MAG: TonB-dependent receptor, partial [Gammaproteobacteria bacterium]|nr:TonB-dependent receptor [Gammaproteobacteria bacterium]